MSVATFTSRSSDLKRGWPLVALLIVIALVTGLGSWISPAISRATTLMLINLVVVVGLYTFIGHSGVFSFGHTAFMLVGAYVTGVLALSSELKSLVLPHLPESLSMLQMTPFAAAICGGIAATLVGMAVAIPIVRMTPLAASLATFAILAIFFNIAQNWQAIGGSTGVAEVPIVVDTKIALACACAVVALAFLYQETRWGLRLRASREDEAAARSVGAPVSADRYFAFVLSAFIVGIGGSLYALHFGFFTPTTFFVSAAFVTLVMLLVGGKTSLAGAVVGTIAISAVQEVLSEAELQVGAAGIQELVLAILLVVIMIARPLGLMNGREISWPFGRDDHGR